MNHANAGFPPGAKTKFRTAAQAVLPVFPPSPDDWRPFGVDIWEGYGAIDWGKLKAYDNPSADFVLIRSGQGHPTSGTPERFYKDPQFASNVYQAVTLGIPWIQYHVFLPNYKDVKWQASYAMELAERAGHLPCALAWDHQLKNGMGPTTINGRLHEVVDWSDSFYDGSRPIMIYTAKWVFEQIAAYALWMEKIPFWWAKWSNTQESLGVSQNDLPRLMNLSQVKIQQTTSQGDGKLLGSQMRRMTFDRAMMDKVQFYKWLGISEAPVDPDHEIRLDQLEEWVAFHEAQQAEIARIIQG